MYYYGYNGGYNQGGYNQPCNTGYVGTTSGYGFGAALWIVLFILLVIIIGAGWSNWGQKENHHDCHNHDKC